MRRRTLLAGSAMLGLFGAGAAACGSNTRTAGGGGDSGGKLTIGTHVDAPTWDPSLASPIHGLQYLQPIYDSLLRRAPDGELIPMLASEWETSEDRLTITFKLREDVTFGDGAELDAEAVRLNLERMQKGTGGAASRMDAVDSIETPDQSTVVLNLSTPNPALLDFLAGNVGGFIASPVAIEEEQLESAPIGSGPYELDAERTTRGSQYVFTKREQYWDPDLQHFDEVEIRVLETGTPILNGLLSGQVDAAQLTPKTAAPAKEEGFEELSYPVDFFGLFLMDREGELAAPLADKRVRQAINFAIDKESFLAQVAMGYGELTSSSFGPDSSAYLPELDDYYSYDPDKSKQLLADAGYENGFEITVPTSANDDPAVTATLQENLSAVGIEVQWETVTPADYLPELRNGTYPMATFSQAQNKTWRAIQTLILPAANFNPMRIEDSEVARLTDIIQQAEVDSDEEISAAQELNRYIVEEAWYAPFYRVLTTYFSNDTVVVEGQAMQAIPSLYSYSRP